MLSEGPSQTGMRSGKETEFEPLKEKSLRVRFLKAKP